MPFRKSFRQFSSVLQGHGSTFVRIVWQNMDGVQTVLFCTISAPSMYISLLPYSQIKPITVPFRVKPDNPSSSSQRALHFRTNQHTVSIQSRREHLARLSVPQARARRGVHTPITHEQRLNRIIRMAGRALRNRVR